MRTTLIAFIFASLAAAQVATVRVVVTNEAGAVTSNVVVNTTDEELGLVNEHRLSLINTPAVAEVKDGQGNVTVPAQPAVLTYPTRAAWWRMLIVNNIRSIAGERTKAVLARKAAVDAAQAALQVEIEKVAQ